MRALSLQLTAPPTATRSELTDPHTHRNIPLRVPEKFVQDTAFFKGGARRTFTSSSILTTTPSQAVHWFQKQRAYLQATPQAEAVQAIHSSSASKPPKFFNVFTQLLSHVPYRSLARP